MSASRMLPKHLRVAVVAPPWFTIPPDGYGGIRAMVLAGRAGRPRPPGHPDRRGRLPQRASCRPARRPPVARLGAFPRSSPSRWTSTWRTWTWTWSTTTRWTAPDGQGPPRPDLLCAHRPVTGELGQCYRLLSRHHHLVAISESQRAKGPHLPWAATVLRHPGRQYPFETDKDDFVLFLSRISPEKAPDLAIKAAQAPPAGKIVVAAKCNEPARARLLRGAGPAPARPRRRVVRPRHREGKAAGRGQRAGLPIQWDDPFGIVMVEAMACGTPVVALRAGSVPGWWSTASPATSATGPRNCRRSGGSGASTKCRQLVSDWLRRAGHGRRLRAGLPPGDRPGGHSRRLGVGHDLAAQDHAPPVDPVVEDGGGQLGDGRSVRMVRP